MDTVENQDIFSKIAKQLIIRFHTSSIDKFLQARIVFQRHGLNLGYFRESQEPYNEEYDMGKKQLLQRALDEIRKRIGANSLFFVEDTSVKIDALSDDSTVFPGLKIKEWFRDTTFEDLDAMLKCQGNNRSATIYSDIGLYIPGLDRAIFVHGETIGSISEMPPDFEKSRQYPWLTPETFNGWFVPYGSNKTLGEMEFEESFKYDFRIKSLISLLERIKEYTAIINLPNNSYKALKSNIPDGTPQLFPDRFPILVIGRICAGKTTFGDYASNQRNRYHIEASDIMRNLAHGIGIEHSQSAFNSAKALLRTMGPDIVAKHISSKHNDKLNDGAIITGFRTIEEVVYFRNFYPSCMVIFIDAGDRIRFSRHLERGRFHLGEISTFDEFQNHDHEQWNFGLLAKFQEVVDVAKDVADIQIDNQGTKGQYYARIDALLDGQIQGIPGVSKLNSDKEFLQNRRIFRCLQALSKFRHPTTCSEIQKQMIHAPISHRHINWILKNFPQFAIRMTGYGKIRYQILPSGRAYIEAIKSKIEPAHTKMK